MKKKTTLMLCECGKTVHFTEDVEGSLKFNVEGKSTIIKTGETKIWPVCLVHDWEREDAPCICPAERFTRPKLTVTHRGFGEKVWVLKKSGLRYFIRKALRCFGVFWGEDEYEDIYVREFFSFDTTALKDEDTIVSVDFSSRN